ncbi:DUF5689 domain-containing protein [Sphingobacterium tabacisoli]|uniref:DUF5689 domain-containing protein n=1 Tax=Sphingobacterium tabacisoli TaxID=2044855 RepID=A0ABW5L5E7_9SPHI|nr:DUF5689 domain-containing protein [Sphingobacterium tabacisoli]
MKKILNRILKSSGFVVLATTMGLFHSCDDKEKNFIGELSPYIALEDVRALYKGQTLTLNSDNLNGASQIYGTVISDHRSGNVPEGTIVLQQYKRNRLRGLTLHVGQEAANYLPGDSIVVNINNKTLSKTGFLRIENVTTSDIEKVSSGNTILQLTTGIININTSPENYEGTFIKIVGGQMTPKPKDGEVFEGSKVLLQAANTIRINTLPTAEYAQMQVPRNITVSGLLLGTTIDSKEELAIYPRYKRDIIDVSDPDVPEYIGATPIIITGFCNDPSGGDGNYEYIQLMANVDINFKEVPFSLVTSNNAGSILHTAGWATGGDKTYKFNLTDGSVKKGELFYVGGHQKKINGANSTSISNAKWIRVISTSNTSGDGLGNPSSNFLPNSGNAGGISLFIGTNISEESVPIDVIFYGGTATASIISEDKKLGYRIANTDHYSQYIAETGEATPFFSMGGDAKINDFRFEHHGGPTNTDIGYFFQLGGTFNTTTRKWDSARERTLILLDKQSTIQQIEQGNGMTKQIN